MFGGGAGMNHQQQPHFPSNGPGIHGPPPMGGPNGPPGARSGSTNPSYFKNDTKKGEVNELKNLLREVTVEKDVKRKREIIKKVIAYMTLGIDVSRLFSEMVLCVDTKDIISKKMVYLYLTNLANKNSELAIMCINTLLNDCRNEDPMVRGLALRSLCSLRLDSILEYIHDPLQQSLTDTSAYVRKTGVIGILKVYSLNPDLIKESDIIDTLYNMIRDRDPQVVSNCLVVLNEIMADEGGIAINQQIILHLLSRISDFNEWGQCNILNILSRYKPANQQEVFTIMNILEQCLRVSNSAVVLGTARCFFHLTERMEAIQDQVFERMRQPLLTLMAGGSHELNFCVLHHILLMVGKKPHIFAREYRQFYTRYNEPTHVKYVKIEILAAIANIHNVADIITELSEYVSDVDQEIGRWSIRAFSKIAVTTRTEEYEQNEAAMEAMAAMQDQIVDTMVDFLELDLPYVRDEALVVMKDLLRKYPDKRHDILNVLPRIVPNVQQPDAKAACIWMLGAFGEDCRRAPYVLEKIIDDFSEETSPIVLLELLSASLTLFFKRPPEMQSMLGRLLQAAIEENSHPDVKDRALLYYRLLELENTDEAAAIVGQMHLDAPNIDTFAELTESDLQERLFQEFDSLSVVYNKPSELFVAPSHMAAAPEEDEEEEDEEGNEDHEENPQEPESYAPQRMQQNQQITPEPSGGNDLLDMVFGETDQPPQQQSVSPSLQLVPNPSMDAPTFQSKWTNGRVVGSVAVQLPQLPAQSDIERAFAAHGIMTMASGDVGGTYKFFFYAQDVAGNTFLSETLISKADRMLRATVKGESDALGIQFCELLKRALFG